MEYKKYRVRTPIKSFRDLEVYRQTTLLSSEVFQFVSRIKKNKKEKDLLGEFEILYSQSKIVPKLIAESYGDKFSDKDMAMAKLEHSMRVISNIVAKIDFIVAVLKDQELKGSLNKILAKYQTQRVKINNLRRAWLRVYSPDREKRGYRASK